jgi:hypothetical protein
MRLSWTSALLAALLALGLITLAGTTARTADDKKPADKADVEKVPFVGNWKVTVLFGADEDTSFIVKVEDKDGKPGMSLVWAPEQLKAQPTVEAPRIDGKAIHFDLKLGGQVFHMNAYVPKGEKEPKMLQGSADVRSQYYVLLLQKTDATEVEKDEARKPTPGGSDYRKAMTTKDDKEREAALKEVLEKNDGKPITVPAALALVQLKAKDFEKEEEVGKVADNYVKVAGVYGPELEQQANLQVARQFLNSEKGSGLALNYARKAEKAVTKDTPSAQAVTILKTLAKALTKAKKDDEVKPLQARIAKLDRELDEQFEKTSIPFEPDAFKGRKAASHRVAVVELFTGAHCPPCVAADVAFDAGLKTFKSKDVVFLEYHLHIPRPDPLTNADAEARQKFYGDEIGGTPTAFVNGKTTDPMGGGKQQGKDSYDVLRKTIEDALETDAPAEMQVKVNRTGDKVEAEARVIDLKKPDDKLRLHIVLIEDVVRYPGTNGQRLHHHVVRAFPGGTEGIGLKEATTKNKVTIDLGDVTKTLTTYLEEADKKHPFLDEERPTTLGNLKIVAFIQHDDSKEIVQATQADVPEAK